MFKALLRIYARLPLPTIHAIGAVIGWSMYLCDKKFAKRIWNNLGIAKIAANDDEHRRLVHRSVAETGKGIAESFAIWFRDAASSLKWVKRCEGWQHVEQAWAEQRGIIFLTPHLGCFEITAQYYAQYRPISVLFKPATQKGLAKLIEEGRSKRGVQLAPTNMRGVRSLLKALRSGEAIGILPDQVPELGDGVWVDFFGHRAYTMTLVSKLVETTNATVLLAFGERLPNGKGYVIHIEPLGNDASPQAINNGIERLVRQRPEQYLWSYRRFQNP